MGNKNRSFTLSENIIIKYINSDISANIRIAIKYYFELESEFKPAKLLLAPELDLLVKPSKRRQISVRISNKDIKEIKRISKKYNTTLSDTIDKMLKLYETTKMHGFSVEEVTKMNEKVSLDPSSIERIKITEDLIPDRNYRIKLRLPKKNTTQTTEPKSLYQSIEYVPDNIHLSAKKLRAMLDNFNEKYNSPNSKIIETQITAQQMAKLNKLKVQIAHLLSTKENLSDVLKYCIMYYEKNYFSKKPKHKPVAFTIPGNKTDKCFDTMFENALSICNDKITVIEVCGGSCGVLPMYYNFNQKAYILNELDDDRRNLIIKIKSEPYDLINVCQQIYDLLSNSTYMDFTCRKCTIDAINTFLKLNHCMEEAITLFNYCSSSQELSKMPLHKYLNTFKKRYDNATALHNYIYNAVITGYNLLDLIEYYKNDPNVIFIIDPPYYLTSHCYESEYPDMHFHEELAALLHKIKGRFILCLRINASRANNSKNNKFIDKVLYEFYKKSYGSGKFYMYCDDFDNDKLMINFKNVGTLEAVISNYDFKGCKPIGTVLSRYEKIYLG